jgi:hypothetical protein
MERTVVQSIFEADIWWQHIDLLKAIISACGKTPAEGSWQWNLVLPMEVKVKRPHSKYLTARECKRQWVVWMREPFHYTDIRNVYPTEMTYIHHSILTLFSCSQRGLQWIRRIPKRLARSVYMSIIAQGLANFTNCSSQSLHYKENIILLLIWPNGIIVRDSSSDKYSLAILLLGMAMARRIYGSYGNQVLGLDLTTTGKG